MPITMFPTFLKLKLQKKKVKINCKSISRMEFVTPMGKTLNLSPQIEYSYVIELSKGSCLLDSWLIMSKKNTPHSNELSNGFYSSTQHETSFMLNFMFSCYVYCKKNELFVFLFSCLMFSLSCFCVFLFYLW